VAGGGEQLGGRSPRSVTRLQREVSAAESTPEEDRVDADPVDEDTDVDLVDFFDDVLPDVLAELAQEQLEPDFDGEERQDADAAASASNLLRLRNDRALYDELAAQGFRGARYEMFRAELAAYALPVIRSWIRRGLIFAYCQQKGRPVTASEVDRRDLVDDIAERISLANETVATALNLFHDKALVGGGWSAAGGASLTTYFVGACVGQFSGIFRRWQTARRNWRSAMGAEGGGGRLVDHPALHPAIGEDPADQVASRETVRCRLRRAPDDVKEILSKLVWEDKSQVEVAAELGITAKSVEGRLYRHRKEVQRRRDERRKS